MEASSWRAHITQAASAWAGERCGAEAAVTERVLAVNTAAFADVYRIQFEDGIWIVTPWEVRNGL